MNKLDSEELIYIFKDNDFILFTETYTSILSDISVPNFQVIRLDRTDKNIILNNTGGLPSM